jgi:hypothetical protein
MILLVPYELSSFLLCLALVSAVSRCGRVCHDATLPLLPALECQCILSLLGSRVYRMHDAGAHVTPLEGGRRLLSGHGDVLTGGQRGP